MWVSWASSRSSASSSSKVTRLALKRDFFGGAGVRDGSSSGRSVVNIAFSFNVFCFVFVFWTDVFFKCIFVSPFSLNSTLAINHVLLQKQRSPGGITCFFPTFNGDHILLGSSILLAPVTLRLSTLASPLVRTPEDAGRRRSSWGQKALLFSKEVRLTVGGLGTAQHPFTSRRKIYIDGMFHCIIIEVSQFSLTLSFFFYLIFENSKTKPPKICYGAHILNPISVWTWHLNVFTEN